MVKTMNLATISADFSSIVVNKESRYFCKIASYIFLDDIFPI